MRYPTSARSDRRDLLLIISNRLLRKPTLHTSRCWRKVARHSKLPDKTREGSNLSTEWRWADGRLERLPDLAAELVPLNVDVIVADAFKPGQEARIVHWIQVEPIEFHLARPAGVGGSCDG